MDLCMLREHVGIFMGGSTVVGRAFLHTFPCQESGLVEKAMETARKTTEKSFVVYGE